MSINWNLSDREYQVLKLLVNGNSNSQIAEKLSITIHTVKAHIASMYAKAGIHSRVLLAVKAVKFNIVDYNIPDEELSKLKNICGI